MKITLLVGIHAILLTRFTEGSVIHAPLDIISYDDISHEDRKELEYLHHKLGRPKRAGSGSSDILESLKVAIGQGIKNKIGEIAKGSAVASARLSSSSSHGSSGYGHSYHHSPPESYDHKSLDFWSLKKSILNTLLQAVKAIKGGVIAVKGQLIKGGGYLTAATGKLIVAKGDAVTDLGKKIAASAVLVPYKGHGHSSSGHAEYGPPPESHYSAPSSPEEFYHGSPSAPAPEFHEPEHHHPYHDDKGPSGLLVLKKINGDHHHYHHIAEESKVPQFKHIEHSGPGWGTIITKFLSASSSVDPHKPEPFGHTASGDTHSYHSQSQAHYEVSESKHHHHAVAPSAAGYVVNDEGSPDKEEMEKPSDDSPFEKEPSYLNQNFDDYIDSKKKSQAAKTNPIPQMSQKPNKDQDSDISESPKPSSSPQTSVQNEFDYPTLNVQSLGTAPSPSVNFGKGTYDLYNLPNIGDYPQGFPSSPDSLPMPQSSNGELPASLLDQSLAGQNLFFPSHSPSVIDLTQNSYRQPAFDGTAENYIGQYSNEIPSYYKPLPTPTRTSHNPKQHYQSSASHFAHRPTRLTHYDLPPNSSTKHKSKNARPKLSSTNYKRPLSSTRTTTTKHKPKPTYDVVKSIAYELGPNGPKRLT